jgi:hypothetical protein
VDPKFVPISWDEALDTVAEKMMELRRAGEPDKLMYMRGRYSPTSAPTCCTARLPKIWGTPNYFSHSAICAEAEKMGPGLTQGFFGYRDYDLEKTNCLVVWGCDPLASNRMVPNTIHRFHEIVKRGTVIAVDPRLSNAAAKAQEWLPIKPGTDGALAGAIAHVLLTEGLWSREFVGDFKDGKNLFVAGRPVDEAAFAEKETNGLVKWWNLELKDRTPAWAEKETLIPAAQIVRVARAMGKAGSKTAVWMGPGGDAPAWHLQRDGRACAERPAGFHRCRRRRLAEQQRADHQVRQRRQVRRRPGQDRQQGQEARRPRRQGHAGDDERQAGQRRGHQQRGQRHAQGSGRGEGVPVVVGNFNFSCTGADRWDKAMAKVPFFVHMVTKSFGDDAVRRHRAAVHLQLGRGLVRRRQHGQRPRLCLHPAGAVKRLWDVKQEETEVMWLLAEKLKAKGFPNLFDYYANEFKDPETGKAPDHGAGVQRDRHQDHQLGHLEGQGAAQGRRGHRELGRLQGQGHVQRPEVHAEEGLGRQVRHRHEEVRVLQRDAEEGHCRTRRRSTRPRWTTSWRSAATWRAANRSSCRTTSRPSATAARPTTPSPSSTTSRA